MAEGRSIALWNHTSSIMALLANVNRDPKRRPFKPGDFNPHVRPGDVPKSNVSVAELSANIMAIANQKGRPRG